MFVTNTNTDEYSHASSAEGIPLGHPATALALLSFSEKLKNTCEASINAAENKQ